MKVTSAGLVVTLTLALHTFAAASQRTMPRRPTDAEWDSYRSVQSAIDAPKRQNETIKRADVEHWLTALAWLDTTGKKEFTIERFDLNYQPPYSVRNLKAFEETPYSPTAGPTGAAAAVSANTGFLAGPKGSPWQGIKIRQSYSEVLSIEDPSQDSTKKVDTLQGGLFSYTRNYLTEGNAWLFQGAFILPLVWQNTTRLNPNVGLSDTSNLAVEPDYSHWSTLSWGIVPSASVYRVIGVENIPNTTLKKDVDQLTWRVGIFDKLSVPSHYLDTLTLRAYGVYATDTGFESSIPSGQIEIEPQAFFSRTLTVGYVTQLINKNPTSNKDGEVDPSDNSYLAYQFRLRGHAEYGTVIDAMTGLKTGDFFRVGPIAEIRLDPLGFKALSASFSYEYLPAIVGSNDHNTLLVAGAEYKAIDNQKTHQSLSLKITYTEGGLEISKQPVKTLVAGVGITY
jgi:hypothetical protein